MSIRRTETRNMPVDEHGDWHCVGTFRYLGHVGRGDGTCCNCPAILHYEKVTKPVKMTRREYREIRDIARAELGWSR